MKVYGPYIRDDNRKHVIIINDDGSRRTVSYPKYLMEQKLGRILDPDLETIDHIDNNIENSEDLNIRIIPREKHCLEDAIRVRIDKVFICPICTIEFKIKNVNDYIHNRLKGKAGPFCGKSCAGKYSNLIRYGKIKPLEIDTTDYRIHYKIEKSGPVSK
jgi:hypothetical protein